MNHSKIYILSFLLFISCKTDVEINIDKVYLYISHTRTNDNISINKEAELINYSKYDLLMLGGDLANSSSDHDSTLLYLDSLFELSSSKTLWSLGNHDTEDLGLIKKYTKKNNYYSYHTDGVTFIVLDTQDNFSKITGNQLAFFNNVIDTIQYSTHVVLLHHKLIWMLDGNKLESKIDDISNVSIGERYFDLNENNFYKAIYPKLKTLESKGIQTICVGGDIGNRVSEFEYLTNDDVQFIASGISIKNEDNKVLLFHHNPLNHSLTWEFKSISNL